MTNPSNPKVKSIGNDFLKTMKTKPFQKDDVSEWKLEKLLASATIVAEFITGKGSDAEAAKKASQTLKIEIRDLRNELDASKSGSESPSRGRRNGKFARCLRKANRAHDKCMKDVLDVPLPESDGPGTEWLDDPAWECVFQLLRDMADCGDNSISL